MTYWFHDDHMDAYTYSEAEAAYDAMWIEVSELTKPVHFRLHGTCTLIDCFRDGKPIFQGDPRLTEVPF